MSIKVRWGAPGSYKTSAAVADDFVKAVMAGRTIVTNVRGLNDKEKITQAIERQFGGFRLTAKFPFISFAPFQVPDTFELYHVPTHEHEDALSNREHLARWFHSLPKGALLLLDEAQDIWPKRWTQKDLDKFDYPGGVEAASKDKRPANFNQAFEMHRHHGWDIVLTTPNITLIRPDIRATAEGAFRHDNQAMIGFSGWFMETFHMAINTGKSKNDALTVRPFRRIPKFVWGLYQSTATGDVKDTIAGLSIVKNPRFLFLLAFLALVVSYLVHLGKPKVITLGADSQASVSAPVANPSTVAQQPLVAVQAAAAPAVPGGGRVLGSSPPASAVALMPRPFAGYTFRIVGNYLTSDGVRRYLYLVENQSEEIQLREVDLIEAGYSVRHMGQCNAVIFYYKEYQEFVTCRKPKSRKVQPGFSDMPLASVSYDVVLSQAPSLPLPVSDVSKPKP